MAFLFPNQRISYVDKTKNNNEWCKQMIKYFFKYSNTYSNNYVNKLSNYQLYNNIINQKDFDKDCNTLGIDVGQFKDIILPYNKTYNKLNSLLGQELRRPFKFMAVLLNSEGIKKKENQKSLMLQQWIENQVQLSAAKIQAEMAQKQAELQQKMQIQAQQQAQEGPNELAQITADPAQEQAQQAMMQELQEYQQHLQEQANRLVPPEEIEKWFSTKYRDSREITANQILNYLVVTEGIKDKKNDTFKHGLISGEEYVWVGVWGNKPTVKPINSIEFFGHKSVDTKYYQDGLFAGHKHYMPVMDILAEYGEDLEKEDLEKLENRSGRMAGMHNMGTIAGPGGINKDMQYAFDTTEDFYWSEPGTSIEGQYGPRKNDEYLVMPVEWVSQRSIGFLKFQNEFGDEQVTMVDENFKVPKDATKKEEIVSGKKKTYYYFTITSVDEQGNPVQTMFQYEQTWVAQVWEGTMIGGDIFCRIGPKKYSYFSIQHPNKTKLGYHGVVYNNMNATSVSLMDRMKPYQYLYFIVMHKLKKLIAQDRGKVYHFDTTMVPEELGLEKTLYYLDELNIDLYNPLQNSELPGAYQRSKTTGSTDRSNMQYILSYVNLLDYLDRMIGDAAGIPKVMEGQTGANQAVTNAQSDLQQSSIVTEIFFNIHNKLWEDALNSLLSVARRFYKDNNITHLQYILDDLSIETVNMSEDDLEDADLGLFVTDSIKENHVFEVLTQMSQALIQNDKANFSHIIDILKADSLASLQREIKVFEKEQKEQAAEQYKQQAEMQREAALFARETMLMKEQATTDREIAKAKITVFQFQKDLDANNNGTPDFIDIENLKLKVKDSDRKNDLEKEKLSLKEKEIEIKKQIANKKPSGK